MKQPLKHMGVEAVQMLIDHVHNPKRERKISVHVPQLVVRSSTAPLR